MLTGVKSIHERLTLELIEHISLGIYQPEDRLPSVRELSSQYRVNPNTITKVYANLEADGYVYSIPAKGYYVARAENRQQDKTKAEVEAVVHLLFILSKLAGLEVNEIKQLIDKAFTKEANSND